MKANPGLRITTDEKHAFRHLETVKTTHQRRQFDLDDDEFGPALLGLL
jgi:hypothetical protein